MARKDKQPIDLDHLDQIFVLDDAYNLEVANFLKAIDAANFQLNSIARNTISSATTLDPLLPATEIARVINSIFRDIMAIREINSITKTNIKQKGNHLIHAYNNFFEPHQHNPYTTVEPAPESESARDAANQAGANALAKKELGNMLIKNACEIKAKEKSGLQKIAQKNEHEIRKQQQRSKSCPPTTSKQVWRTSNLIEQAPAPTLGALEQQRNSQAIFAPIREEENPFDLSFDADMFDHKNAEESGYQSVTIDDLVDGYDKVTPDNADNENGPSGLGPNF